MPKQSFSFKRDSYSTQAAQNRQTAVTDQLQQPPDEPTIDPRRLINVTITTLESDLDFAIQTNTLGKNLFDQVCHTLGLKEAWYFGLQYVDNKGVTSWLRMNKRVKDQNLQKQYPLRFKFLVKLYPEDVTIHIIQDVTMRMFYQQVAELIISDVVYCPPETSVLLASYICQEKFGDFDPEMYKTSCLDIECLIPKRVVVQHRLTPSQWEEKIVDCWLEHKDQLREEAMLSYLKIAQDLEMYGVNYFEIYNKKGSQLWLGIDALGLNIYHSNDKLAPQIGFPWSEINNISYSMKKFIIQTASNKAPDFIFLTDKSRINKTILDLCIRNHELYITRRMPETPEILQMKMLAAAEKKDKGEERQRLKKERDGRLAAEHTQRVLQQRLLALEQEQQASKKALLLYQAKSTELERKITESETQSQKLANLHISAEQEKQALEQQLSSQLEEKQDLKQRYIETEELAKKRAQAAEEMSKQSLHLKEETDSGIQTNSFTEHSSTDQFTNPEAQLELVLESRPNSESDDCSESDNLLVKSESSNNDLDLEEEFSQLSTIIANFESLSEPCNKPISSNMILRNRQPKKDKSI